MADRTDTNYTAETLAKYGMNAQLQVAQIGSSPGEWESIAGIRTIEPGEKTTSDILLTHLRSPDAHEEHGPGRRDSGPFSFTAIWMPDEQSQSRAGGGSVAFASGGLFEIERTRQIRDFRIVFEDGGSPEGFKWPFRGYIASLQPGTVEDNNIVELSGSIQPVLDYSSSLP
jgi:hypothetical protein